MRELGDLIVTVTVVWYGWHCASNAGRILTGWGRAGSPYLTALFPGNVGNVSTPFAKPGL